MDRCIEECRNYQLPSLITHGESKTIEYKQSMAELEKLGKAICGMLNTTGGYGSLALPMLEK